MSPNVFNTVFNDRPAYATNDLLQQHPTKSHLFRFYGRVDDQLMLSTGEKTNPAPLGAYLLLSDSPYVTMLMFTSHDQQKRFCRKTLACKCDCGVLGLVEIECTDEAARLVDVIDFNLDITLHVS